MTYQLRKNWQAILIVGVLATAGAFFLCKMTPGCLLGPAISDELTIKQEPNGGETVSTDTQPQRKVEYADESTFEQEVLRSDVPVLVDFYADWCGPCRALAPTLEELAQELPDAKIVKVNVDENLDLAVRYGVNSIPNVKVFKDGEITAQHLGLASKDYLRSLINR